LNTPYTDTTDLSLHPLQVHLLGKPHAVLPDGAVVQFPMDNTLLMMAYLSLNPAKRHRRTDLAALFYPDHDDRRANQNIRQTIHRLRKLLGDDERENPGLLVDSVTIQVNPSGILASDIHRFTTKHQAVQMFTQTHSHRRPDICLTCKERYSELAALYPGDFLDGFSPRTDSALDDWVPDTRQEYNLKINHILHWLAKFHFEYRQFEPCMDYLARILKIDPFDENAVRMVMRVLSTTGKRNQALLRFHEFQVKLLQTLEIEPEEETILLAQAIRSGEQADKKKNSSAAAPALFSRQELQPQLLPDTGLPFFNRTQEIERICDLLESREHRLIVIQGVIGSGKTRLAMHIAGMVRGVWADDVHMVPILKHQHASLPAAMVQALDLPSANSFDHRKNLLQFLRDKESLFILDNLDELPDQSEVLLSILLHCPRVKFIITTRRQLNIRGEKVIEIGGLRYPALADTVEELTGAELEAFIHQHSALQLYRDVARRARENFKLDASNIRDVVDTCEMLVGLPLAVELAAGYARIFNCREIRAGVYGCLHGNPEMAAFVAGRHGQFVKRFDTIWEGLSAAERGLVKRIYPFLDGVKSADLLNGALASIEVLAALLEKSALVAVGDGRVKLHPLVRFFACP
jgi:DNA-binding SARP family transcriptional activator/predicted ATPase